MLLVALVLVAGTVWWLVALQQTAIGARQRLSAARDALSEAGLAREVAGTGGEHAGPAGQDAGLPSAAGATGVRIATACAEVAGADAALQHVGRQLQLVMPLVSVIEGLPAVGGQARAQAHALEVGTLLASAGAALCQGLEPFAGLLSSPDKIGGVESSADTLRALVASRPALLRAADELSRLQQSLDRLSEAELDEGSRRGIVTLHQRMPPIRQTLQDSAALLDLLGARGTRRFLLVSQNPDELRATGGYIGSAGLVEAHEGEIRLVEYGSSRAYDTPGHLRVVPPQALASYLGPGY